MTTIKIDQSLHDTLLSRGSQEISLSGQPTLLRVVQIMTTVVIVLFMAEKYLLWYIAGVWHNAQKTINCSLFKQSFTIMSILKIYQYPDTVLRKKTQKITTFDNDLTQVVDDMVETMYDAPGVGLAAPQVGKSIQLIVVDTTEDKEGEKEHMVLINPKIIVSEGKQIDEEGCLSVPELSANVKRYRKITVSFQDLQGKAHELSTEDRFAVVLQHEIDHLNGILFIDHLSPLKRNLYKKKVKKWLKKE